MDHIFQESRGKMKKVLLECTQICKKAIKNYYFLLKSSKNVQRKKIRIFEKLAYKFRADIFDFYVKPRSRKFFFQENEYLLAQ